MKKLTLLTLAIIGFTLVSCDEDQDIFTVNANENPVLIAPEANSSLILTPQTAANPATTVVWEAADYETPVAVTYTVQIAVSGTDFATPVNAGSTSNLFLTWTVAQLNGASIGAGLSPFTQGSLDVRVKASVNGVDDMFSNSTTILVTPYTTELPKIAVPGNHQGWSPPTAPRLAASAYGETDYEGYVWLDGGHKFVGPDDSGNFAWGNIDWGDDGTFSGALVAEGESDCMATAGYYLIKANTTTLTYTETKYNWGLIGSATPTGWDSDTDMIYDAPSKTWKLTVNLIGGEFIKFRANDGWDWNYGDNDADGSLENGGSDIPVAASGNYTVVLDLSNPRAYTYSVTLN